MAYVSLYRKYRPQTFDEVVGQEHVTTTLRNAISAGRVGSGYLFTGTRGTAKTTCARILAKALNCIGEDETRTAPTPTPCGVCGPCRSIAASSFVDVLEMDAASHGKVDDVRDLVASIKFPPMEGRYKVYIIDEAHQLSRDAMDAFLKTLEEPPDRVVFVLATTELDKLPITIASRCQVFEFKRGSVAAISSRLNAVLATEGVAADPDAVTLVARAADGSYRDSLSLLEQVLAYKPSGLTAPDVSRVLGTVDDDLLSDIVGKIAAHDAAGLFSAADAITSGGKDVRQFLRTLSTRLRDMLFVSVGGHASEGEVSASARDQAGVLAPGTLLRALEILSETERDMRWSSQHRLVLEITLLRLGSLGGHEAAFASVPQAAPPKAKPVETPPVRQARPEEPPAAEVPPVAPEVAATVAVVQPLPVPDATPDLDDDLDDSDSADAVADLDEDIDSLPLGAVLPPIDDADLLKVQQVPTAPKPFADAPKPSSPNAPADLVRLQRSWQEVVNTMSSRSAPGAAMIRDAVPVTMTGSVVTLRLTNKFNFERLSANERGRKLIEDIINRQLAVDPGTYRIQCTFGDDAPAAGAHPPTAAMRQSVAPAAPPHEEESDELLQTVIAVFGPPVNGG